MCLFIKHSVWLFFLAYLFIDKCFAQKVRVGINAGVAFSDASVKVPAGSTPNSYKGLRGFWAGGFLHIPIETNLVLRPGVHYVGKGVKTNYGSHERLDYFEIPVNLFYKWSSKNGSVYAGGGLFISFLSFDNYNYYNYSNGRANYKHTDAGVNLAACFELPIGFSFNLNYAYSLVNISNIPEYIKTWKNRCFAVGVGYLF